MKNFVLKEIISSNIESELEYIGFDIAYRKKAAEKFIYKTFKIFDLTIPQANILKQTALSFGADCGVHRDVLTASIDKTDVILGGSFSQLKKISEKLKLQPFSLPSLANLILANLGENSASKVKLVGILNITPDSFSDGGKYFDKDSALKQLYQLVEAGADMIDVGAESTRPGFIPVPIKEQINRLGLIVKEFEKLDIPVSVDTRSSEVAKFVLDNGAKYINDVSGLEYDSKILEIVAEYNAGLIIQHSKEKSIYEDLISEIYFSLKKKSELAQEKGITDIIIDPGIGFGKTKQQNLEILDRIVEFKSIGLPIYVGTSRKSFLGIESDDNELKDAITLAVNYPLIKQGVDFLRVHNVKLHRQLIDSVI